MGSKALREEMSKQATLVLYRFLMRAAQRLKPNEKMLVRESEPPMHRGVFAYTPLAGDALAPCD